MRANKTSWAGTSLIDDEDIIENLDPNELGDILEDTSYNARE